MMAQRVRHLLTMLETRVHSLGGEDPLEEEMATHSSILAWKNPMDRGAWQDTTEQLHFHFHLWSLQYMWGNIDDVCSGKSGGHRVAKFLIFMVFTWNSVTFKL